MGLNRREGGDIEQETISPLEKLSLIESNTDAVSGASLNANFLITIFILHL